MRTLSLVVVLLSLYGCIGTDYVDNPKDSSILLDKMQLSLLIGQSGQITADYYYNMWIQEERPISWRSDNASIATVVDGEVTGVAKGQTRVWAWVPGEDTVSALVTVVEDEMSVSEVLISTPNSSLDIGQTVQLTAVVKDLTGAEISGSPVAWASSNTMACTINANGLVTGVGDGVSQITATVDGVSSPPLPLMVGVVGRTGTFQGANGYNASGIAMLSAGSDGKVTLELSSDFRTSFALGTFVYLSNSTSGSIVASQGLEVSEISGNGSHIFNISNLDPDVTIDTYRYVIMLCKPASITFGFAELK